MKSFTFAGSQPKAGRTTSSLLFAAGARAIGLHPLHIEIMPVGGSSSLEGMTDVPFPMERVFADKALSFWKGIRSFVRRYPMCIPVVDVPAVGIQDQIRFTDGARILIPIRDEAEFIMQAVHDFGEARATPAEQSRNRRRMVRPSASVWLLPIGWPRGFEPEDYPAILARRQHPRSPAESFSVVCPGIPFLNPGRLGFRERNGRFRLSEEQRNAAVGLVQAALSETDTSPEPSAQ